MEPDAAILSIGVDFARIEAALVPAAGGVVHVHSVGLRRVSAGGSVYIDPAHLIGAAVQAVKALVELKPREARRVAGVSIIARSPTATYVTAKGPETPFLLPEDEKVSRTRSSFGAPFGDIYARVNLTRPGCQVPFALAAAGRPGTGAVLCAPKDYVKWVLTGEFSTDALDAQRTFAWDLARREWSDDLCKTFSIPARTLPKVLPATAVAGHVTKEAARATGLKAGLPVACGMGDWGEYLGSGAFEPGDVFEHIGTTGAFFGVTAGRPDARFGFDVRPHVIDGRYLVGRQGLPGGACLEWLLTKTYLSHNGEIDWVAADLELEAAAAMGKPENVLFFPNLSGAEGQIADAAFLNLRPEDDVTSLVQGTMEGLFFTLKAVAGELKGTGWTPKAVFTTGQVGFKHAPKKMRSHIYGLPIHAGKTPGANVLSAAIVGAVACGAYANVEEARSKMLSLDGGAMPDRAASKMYDAHFASWAGARSFLTAGQPPTDHQGTENA